LTSTLTHPYNNEILLLLSPPTIPILPSSPFSGGDGDDVAVDADGRAGGIASDDEAGSDGRDDTRAYDANNQKHGASSSSSESESEGDSEDYEMGSERYAARQKRDKDMWAKLMAEQERQGKRGKVRDGTRRRGRSTRNNASLEIKR
jgi:hypothetical protein